MTSRRTRHSAIRGAVLLFLLFGLLSTTAVAGCHSLGLNASAGNAFRNTDSGMPMNGCCAEFRDHTHRPGLSEALPATASQPLATPPAPDLYWAVGARAGNAAVSATLPAPERPPLYLLYHRLLIPFRA